MLRYVFALAGLSGALAFGPAAVSAETLRVTIDQARVIELPQGVATVALGNPAIADATLLKAGGGLVLTGHGYGRTNLLVLDANGDLVAEKEIVVEPPTGLLVVQNGGARQSYHCDPACMPSPALGDAPAYFGDVSGAIDAHDALAGRSGGGPEGGSASGRSAVVRVIGPE